MYRSAEIHLIISALTSVFLPPTRRGYSGTGSVTLYTSLHIFNACRAPGHQVGTELNLNDWLTPPDLKLFLENKPFQWWEGEKESVSLLPGICRYTFNKTTSQGHPSSLGKSLGKYLAPVFCNPYFTWMENANKFSQICFVVLYGSIKLPLKTKLPPQFCNWHLC